ncbi:MAG: hypothetical protein AAF467_25750 [Actinomycetota bacterium]
MFVSRSHLAAVVATAATASILLFTGPAAADDMPDELRPRVEAICARVPVAEDRVDRLLARIDGDESVRGSLARLEARLQRAEDDGRIDAATVLTNRITTRTAARELLAARQNEIHVIADLCAEHGFTTDGSTDGAST